MAGDLAGADADDCQLYGCGVCPAMKNALAWLQMGASYLIIAAAAAGAGYTVGALDSAAIDGQRCKMHPREPILLCDIGADALAAVMMQRERAPTAVAALEPTRVVTVETRDGEIVQQPESDQ